VRDVQEKTLVDATFKHRARGNLGEFDVVIQAKRAVLQIDPGAKVVRVSLEQAEVQSLRRDSDVVLLNKRILEFPIPLDIPPIAEPTKQGQTRASLERRIVEMDSDQALSLAYSSDGKTLASAGFDGVVHLWDMAKSTEVAQLPGEK